MHVLSYLLLQFMAAIIISATVIISVLQLNFHVCNLANLRLQLSPTSGNFPKPLCSCWQQGHRPLLGVWPWECKAVPGGGPKANPWPGGMSAATWVI